MVCRNPTRHFPVLRTSDHIASSCPHTCHDKIRDSPDILDFRIFRTQASAHNDSRADKCYQTDHGAGGCNAHLRGAAQLVPVDGCASGDSFSFHAQPVQQEGVRGFHPQQMDSFRGDCCRHRGCQRSLRQIYHD